MSRNCPAATRKKSYRFVELGRGQVDLPAVFKALHKVNFRGWAIVELDDVPDKIAHTEGVRRDQQEISRRETRDHHMKSPFRIAVINDEISQDFGHACEIASREFGMDWIELRGMWNKNILKLDANEVAEARRILEKYKLRVTDIASPLFKVDWPGAPQSKFSPKRDQFNADFTFDQQAEVLERSIALAKAFQTDRVRCSISGASTIKPRIAPRSTRSCARPPANRRRKGRLFCFSKTKWLATPATAAESAKVLDRRAKSANFMLNWDPGKRRRAGRDAVSRWLQSAAEGPHRPLPLQRRRERSPTAKATTGPRWARGIVDWTGQFAALKARRLSLRREPRNALARRRHARKNRRAKAGPE